MDLPESTSKLQQAIGDFYRRLLNGDIEKAKASSNYISNLVSNIQNELARKIATTNDENIINLRRELQEKFADWKLLVEKELEGISNKDFEEDPVTWRKLFEDSFKELTNKLSLIIQRLCSLINEDLRDISSSQQTQGTPTENYNNIKYNKKVYSNNLSIINDVETKIRERISLRDYNNKKITGEIKSGPWKGFRHAHLPMPLGDHRIVYKVEGKNVIFHNIDTHKNLGIS